jgi:hypothetical protein
MAVKYPEVLVRLDGAGDDFRIVGQVTKAMRRVGIAEEEIETFCDEAISGMTTTCCGYVDGGSRWRLGGRKPARPQADGARQAQSAGEIFYRGSMAVSAERRALKLLASSPDGCPILATDRKACLARGDAGPSNYSICIERSWSSST